MLQQILDTMFVDPELLDLMTPDQKELLFRKMRDEQLRKWNSKEKELAAKPARKRAAKKIQFRLGADGKPWTWVMGEHGRDLPYDELVRQREKREREKEEEEEREIQRQAAEFAKLETGHILSLASRFGEMNSSSHSPSHSPSISPYMKRRSLDEGQPMKKPVRRLVSESAVSQKARGSLPTNLLSVPEGSSSLSSFPRTESQLDLTSCNDHIDGEASPTTSQGSQRGRDDLRRQALKKQVPAIGRTKEEQQQFQEKRTQEILSTMREVNALKKKKSMDVAHRIERSWRESEEKAKAFERTRKASFNKAKQLSLKLPSIGERQILEGIPEDTKKELQERIWDRNKQTRRAVRPGRMAPSKPPLVRRSSVFLPGTRPKTLDHVVVWFREKEAPSGRCREKDGTISLWFHGRLGRPSAELLLDKKPVGSFLVRLSVKAWGYTISVRTYTEVKHFLVDVSSGMYQFLGPKQKQFRSLNDLLYYYRSNPITSAGQEVLLVPVVQTESEDSELFTDLFREGDDDEEVWSTCL